MELTTYDPPLAPVVSSLNGHVPALAPLSAARPGNGRPAARPEKTSRFARLHNTSTLGTLFYAVVLVIALAGGSTAAEDWLGWWLPFCVAVVAAVELGGVYLSVMADERRRLGEAAIAARIGSVLVATGGVALNWYGHTHQIQAAVFAGFSGGGYAIWIIRSGQKRRDALRKLGMLAQSPPFYGPIQWICHPTLTHRARALAVEKPTLGLHGSLRKAAEDVATERRHKAIIRLVKGDMTEVFGSAYAELVVTIADPRRLAVEIERLTDWEGVAKVYAGRVDPSRLATEARKRGRRVVAVSARPTVRPDDADHTPQQTPSNALTRSTKRVTDASRTDWWTREREDFYTRVYAPRLDASGVEVGGTDLASGLRLERGTARAARIQRLRPRYAEEVANRMRVPHASLPDPIARKVAEHTVDTVRSDAQGDA